MPVKTIQHLSLSAFLPIKIHADAFEVSFVFGAQARKIGVEEARVQGLKCAVDGDIIIENIEPVDALAVVMVTIDKEEVRNVFILSLQQRSGEKKQNEELGVAHPVKIGEAQELKKRTLWNAGACKTKKEVSNG